MNRKVLQILIGEMAHAVVRGGPIEPLEKLVLATPRERGKMVSAHKAIVEARMENTIAESNVLLAEIRKK
jgi:hypothetical protein